MVRVNSTVLVKGSCNGQREVYLHGSQILSQQEAIETIGKIAGKNMKVFSIPQGQAITVYLNRGIFKPVAEYMRRWFGDSIRKDEVFINCRQRKIIHR